MNKFLKILVLTVTSFLWIFSTANAEEPLSSNEQQTSYLAAKKQLEDTQKNLGEVNKILNELLKSVCSVEDKINKDLRATGQPTIDNSDTCPKEI